MSAPASRRESLAQTAFGWVFALMLANLAFNLVARARGWPYFTTSFLWRSDDNFGDFFSLLHTYSGGEAAVVSDRAGIHAILPDRPVSLTDTMTPRVTNFHMMPLATTVDLGLVRALRWVDPVAMFLALFAMLFAGWVATAWRFAATRHEALTWAALFAVSYPMMMTLARGNLFAGVTALCVVVALLLGLARRAPVWSAMLLAVACNLRPNAILFAAPLLLFYWPQRWRFAVVLGAAGLLILGASLAASNALYPDYHLATIREGLANYYTLYVRRGWGVAYGSSLYGAGRVLFGAGAGLEGAALAISLAVLAAGLWARARGRIDDAVLLFLATASYCLGSTVLGDYHLLAFLVVPMALAASAEHAAFAPMRRLAMVAACLVLAPKNYLFSGNPGRAVSSQVVFNPVLLLAASGLILAIAYATSRSASVRRRAASTPSTAAA